MNLEVDKKHRKFLKEKILRFKPVAFIKKYMAIFVVLFIFLISLIFGIWNVKKYEIYGMDTDVNQNIVNELSTYIDQEVVGRNIFKIKSNELEESILNDFTYIKSISVEKSVPSKLVVFIDTYTKDIVADLCDSKCVLLSNEGYFLEEVCLEEEGECCKKYSEENSLKYLVSKESSVSVDMDGNEKLLIMDNVYKVVKVVESCSYIINDINMDEEVLSVLTEDGKSFVFDFNKDLELQLQRFIIVIGKINEEDSDFRSLDLRFERPVIKN